MADTFRTPGVDGAEHLYAAVRDRGRASETATSTHLAEVAGSRSDSAASVFMRRYPRGVDGSWHEGLLLDLLAADLVG